MALSTTCAIQNLNSYWFKNPIEAEIESECFSEDWDKYEIDVAEQLGEQNYE